MLSTCPWIHLGDVVPTEDSRAALAPLSVVHQVFPVMRLPWGITDSLTYLNMVLRGRTSLDPRELLERLNAWKLRLDAFRACAGAGRIDLDNPRFDDIVPRFTRLTNPHPHLHERAFSLSRWGPGHPDCATHPAQHRRRTVNPHWMPVE